MNIDQYVYIYTIYNNNEHSNRQVNYHTHAYKYVDYECNVIRDRYRHL